MKWYERKNHVGDTEWYTHRNKKGVYFLIKQLPLSGRYRLFISGWADSDYDTLGAAQAAAE